MMRDINFVTNLLKQKEIFCTLVYQSAPVVGGDVFQIPSRRQP